VLALGVIVGLAALLLILFAGDAASAKPRFASEFASVYPEAAASQLNGCLLCHDSAVPQGEERLNPYGYDFGERGDKEFRRIENLDSDGDGFSNIEEILALSFPGDPASTPLTVTTTTTLPGTAPDGAALFASSCASCHGAGGGNLLGTALTQDQFANIVANGAGSSMPAFGAALSAEQIAAIYGYLTGAPAPTTTTLPPGAPIDAVSLYASSCAGCHGADGGSLVPTSLGRAALMDVISNGRGAMPAFASSLSAEQIGALADHLLALSTAPTTTTAPSATPRSGSAVFGSSCAGCHGSSGGNLVGTTLGRSRLIAVISDGAGAMPGFSGRLPASEIDAVASYLLSLAATTTTTEPGSEPDAGHLYMLNCAMCHGTHGEGGPGGTLVGLSLDEARLRSIIADGVGDMPSFGSDLDTAELDSLIDFVLTLTSVGTDQTDGGGVEDVVAAAGTEITETTDTTETISTTSTTVTSAAVTRANVASPAADPEDDPESGRAGSPLIPMIPLVAVAVWAITDGIRGGHLRKVGLFSGSRSG
jgi:mono/diheme cytochrome c family protein